MATRATISVLDPTTGRYLTIYSHWDGYPAHLGHMLTRHYNTHEKALELVRMGNASSIYPNLGERHRFDIDQNKVSEHDKVCTFYGRDRGENDTAPRTYASPYEAQKAEGEEYNYHFDGEEWYVQYDRTERATDAVLMGQIADRIRQYERIQREAELTKA